MYAFSLSKLDKL